MLERRLDGSKDEFELIIDELALDNTCSRDFATRIEALKHSGNLRVTFPNQLRPPENDNGKELEENDDSFNGSNIVDVEHEML
jgi:hypothetical protein